MPKERKEHTISLERAAASPLKRSSSRKRRSEDDVKEWEEARCPVCMEHPHNAVLLLCSSHDKGCRPYMCDTSYRHSNCLDQFRKSSAEISSAGRSDEDISAQHPSEEPDEEGENDVVGAVKDLKNNILCPLCRGRIDGWIVVEPARRFMNKKSRSCACEACDFAGNYPDLRKHARLEHPSVRPSRTDPERERTWRRLERQRDIGDFMSTIRSAIRDEGEEDEVVPVIESGWMTVFLLIRVFRPGGSSRSRRSGTSRARTQVGVRRRSRRLWGESYDGDMPSAPRDEDGESADGPSRPAQMTSPESGP